ncbi:MAG: protein kinase family protein [Deltaproteobacteria bacterium]|nr:protein kinase family protein [Deltaproteobacteria bacterium]
MEQKIKEPNDIISFLRNRDYKMLREIGQGACGKTVLLYDEQIDEYFVCKKYAPTQHSQDLFNGFVREIKLLYKILHENIVRVFAHHLYPAIFTGYIVMEYVDGTAIDKHCAKYPDETNNLFIQAIKGFSYLERSGILHRDIRPENLMVRKDGLLKIIDLGFGKLIEKPDDFNKSISLNWKYETPEDFELSIYDFKTEVYFVGKLFNQIITENKISQFKYTNILAEMCQHSISSRINSFYNIELKIQNNQFDDIGFSIDEVMIYRRFSDAISQHISKIESSAKYKSDIDKIKNNLNNIYSAIKLEEYVPDASIVFKLFISGEFYYAQTGLKVSIVKDFLILLHSANENQAQVILANLHTKLDSLPRYPSMDDDIPF